MAGVPAVAHGHLLPSFHGRLLVESSGDDITVLTGTYRPPLGVIGALGDRLLGHRVAQHTVEELLAKVGRAVEEQARQRERVAPWRPPPAPEALWDRTPAETWLG